MIKKGDQKNIIFNVSDTIFSNYLLLDYKADQSQSPASRWFFDKSQKYSEDNLSDHDETVEEDMAHLSQGLSDSVVSASDYLWHLTPWDKWSLIHNQNTLSLTTYRVRVEFHTLYITSSADKYRCYETHAVLHTFPPSQIYYVLPMEDDILVRVPLDVQCYIVVVDVVLEYKVDEGLSHILRFIVCIVYSELSIYLVKQYPYQSYCCLCYFPPHRMDGYLLYIIFAWWEIGLLTAVRFGVTTDCT